MWEYKITKTNLWYKIYKKMECKWFISMWFLMPNNKWWLDKDSARLFYTQDDALSGLVIIKRKDGKDAD